MDTNLIALAIPFFFLLIAIELVVARAQGLTVYRFNDAVADLSCGIGQQVVTAFFSAALLAAYAWVYQRFALWHPPVWLEWTLAFVGVDLLYYWWHRASHEVNFLWAVHVVHHQSEEYNLAVALRQAWFSTITSWPFYAPLAVLGVGAVPFAVSLSLSTLYQFWIHTRCIGKLGVLEQVLNTPSHHRVHHGRNPRYLDRNHAAVLIVWDRMFGTFQEEDETPIYGTVKPYTSWNALWANFDYFAELARTALTFERPDDRLKLWISEPGWRPGVTHAQIHAEAGALAELNRPVRWDTPLSTGLFWYVFVQITLVVCAATAYLFVELALAPKAIACLLILWTLGALGLLLEGRAAGAPIEAARVLSLCLGAIWLAVR